MKDTSNTRGGFDGTLRPGKRPALLIIDFQRGFTEPELSPLASNCDRQVEATRRLVGAFRGIGPILFTIVGYEQNLSDVGAWIQKCSALRTQIRGTPACELDPRLGYRPETHTMIHKNQASAFFGTSLSTVLAAAGADMVVVAGCTTSGCVRASVVDSLQHGFPPFVVRDCVADRSAAQHESNLIDMHSKYAEVVSLDEMLGLLGEIRAGREVGATA